MTTAENTTEKPRILVVEDDPLAQALLAASLEREGYDYVVVNNGQEAIDRYSTEFFSIIITDWLMPEMDGIELCRLIRSMKIERYIYIIVVTSQNSMDDQIEGLDAGADDYITKPFHHAELSVRLKNACRIIKLETTLKKNMAEIRDLSIHDRLTGCFNRVFMDQQLAQEITRSTRYHHNLSILICDLDHFKAVNDTYGHQAGDIVLKACVERLSELLRHEVDWIARFGGEEFVIILPETGQVGALDLAERMREQIAATPVQYSGCGIDITASFGLVSLIPTDSRQPRVMEQILNIADTCLYQAKNNGRNQVAWAEI